MTEKRFKTLHPFVQERLMREMAVVKATAEALFADGYRIAVDYRHYDVVPLPNGGYRIDRHQGPVRTSWRMLKRDLSECDEELLFAFKPDATCIMDSPDGVISLVWGNNTDVICDYTLNMEKYAQAGYEMAEKIEDEQSAGTIKRFLRRFLKGQK